MRMKIVVYFFGIISTSGNTMYEKTMVYRPTNRPYGSSRIIGGEDAQPGEYPFIASLRTRRNRHFCAGSIISTRHILTAAHCILNRMVDRIVVVIGTSQRFCGGEAYLVSKISVHPGYKGSETSWRNDIGILTLVIPIIYNSLQRPIKLASRLVDRGSIGVILGWGFVKEVNNTVRPNDLQKIEGVIFVAPLCQSLQENSRLFWDQVCSITPKGKGFCSGDSGGPLILDDEIIGIVSYSSGPCGFGGPDIFSSVYYFRNFIWKILLEDLQELFNPTYKEYETPHK